ncbi:unnamed protein product [Zymoseptoria tritici ST99CH_1E4]|uniref:Uncharacterized protein n=1 Tax=Zymoseptoria tritici ST99CH_1E4 TaxID=1276532 RepID=A0A2H1GP11_ZYMTR|nr:unnamed protein product [Zymoseptoria tritici ST99CH_1E4]
MSAPRAFPLELNLRVPEKEEFDMIKKHRDAGLPVLQSLATFRAMGFGVAGLNLPDFPFYRGGPMGPNLPPAQPQSHNNPAPQQSQYNNPQSHSPVAPLYPQAQNYNLPPPAQQQPQPQPQFQNLSQPQQQSPPPAQSNLNKNPVTAQRLVEQPDPPPTFASKLNAQSSGLNASAFAPVKMKDIIAEQGRQGERVARDTTGPTQPARTRPPPKIYHLQREDTRSMAVSEGKLR